MRILFIHGRGQEGFEEDELKENWSNALQLSFVDAGLGRLPESISIDFIYYATELIEQLGKYEGAIKNGDYVFRGNSSDEEIDKFEAFFIDELSKNAKIDKREALKNYGETLQARGIGNTKISISLMKALDNYAHRLANLSIKYFTEDVGAYLIVSNVRNIINQKVVDKLTQEPTIIIAHSLGTVIAYNVLKTIEDKGHDIRMLITLGSPLGVNSVKSQISGRLSWPKSLKGTWHNIYDPLDFVALNPLDSKNFNITPPIINHIVKNDSNNCHSMVHYLGHPLVAKLVSEISSNLTE